jgi:hypothetical protein
MDTLQGMALTDAHKAALKWLKNRGGDGVFDKTQCLIACGERAGVRRATWSRLEAAGMIHRHGPKNRRVGVTELGVMTDVSMVREADCA